MKLDKLLLVPALVAGLAAASANAVELKVSSILAPQGAGADGYNYFADNVAKATNGEVTMQVLHGGVLLTPAQMLSGLPDGVGDVGFLLPPYFPAEFPEFNLAANLAIIGDDALAMTGAIHEYVTTCEPCLAEHARHGHVYLGSYSATGYYAQGRKAFTTVDDLKGFKLRTAMAAQGRWAEHFGAVRVAISGTEAFEAISTGTIDATLAALAEFFNLNLVEVATHVTMLPVGVFNGNSPFSFGAPQWSELTDDQRAAILKVAPYGVATIVTGYVRDEIKAKQVAAERGIKLVEPSAELVAASAAFIEGDVKTAIAEAERTTGIKDAQAKVDRYLALIAKWKGLTATIDRTDPQAFGKLLWDQVWSKIDAKTYGM
ncbi:MAG: C4-dicarboxylate TRAP transporter substrate-binding protein [Pseudomonadota bacterium]|nr:C4-dicarboxylate TRAP transporter substrate-binding protein [Pseudomonadota bacterium]